MRFRLDKARALLYSILRFCSGERVEIDMEGAEEWGLSGGEETLLRRFAGGWWKKSSRVLEGAAIDGENGGKIRIPVFCSGAPFMFEEMFSPN